MVVVAENDWYGQKSKGSAQAVMTILKLLIPPFWIEIYVFLILLIHVLRRLQSRIMYPARRSRAVC